MQHRRRIAGYAIPEEIAADCLSGGGSSSKIGREVRFRGQTGKTYARSEP